MKHLKLATFALSALLLLPGCGSMNNTTKGGLLGAAAGAAIGSGIGAIAGGGKGVAIAGGAGTVVGAAVGAIIGKRMDKKAKEVAAQVADAQVETVTDAQGLAAVRVTLDSGILFETGKAELNSNAKTSLAKFSQVLIKNSDTDITIIGHTDNTGNDGINVPLSLKRAQSVDAYLKSCGVPVGQIKSVEGKGSSEPVASNETAEGRKENRRVEVFMYASQAMIDDAANQAK